MSLLEQDFENEPHKSSALRLIYYCGGRITENLKLRWDESYEPGSTRSNWIDRKRNRFIYGDLKTVEEDGPSKR